MNSAFDNLSMVAKHKTISQTQQDFGKHNIKQNQAISQNTIQFEKKKKTIHKTDKITYYQT